MTDPTNAFERAVFREISNLVKNLALGNAELKLGQSRVGTNSAADFELVPSNPMAAPISGLVGGYRASIYIGSGGYIELSKASANILPDTSSLDELVYITTSVILGDLSEVVTRELKSGDVIRSRITINIGGRSFSFTRSKPFRGLFRRHRSEVIQYQRY